MPQSHLGYFFRWRNDSQKNFEASKFQKSGIFHNRLRKYKKYQTNIDEIYYSESSILCAADIF